MDEARQIIRGVLEIYAPNSRDVMKDQVAEEILEALEPYLKGPAIPVIDQDKLAEALDG